MARRRSNGEGSIYRRKDGRYEGAAYVLTTSGTTKRVRVYGATRAEADRKLTEAKAKNDQGVPVADKTWILGDFLDYWLEQVIKPNRRATTYDLYESNVRLYLKPELGHLSLSRLSVSLLQAFLNRQMAAGNSVRKVQTLREIISSALTRAMREEHITRNVARLVEVKGRQREPIEPWSPDEVRRFLETARSHKWYPAFLFIALYGLRRGEAIGLRWSDVDFDTGQLHIRQQVFRAGGKIHQGPLKTQAGRRDLPLVPVIARTLQAYEHGGEFSHGLIFITTTGHPIEPQNFTRAFQTICQRSGLRRIKLHHLRHSAATILKDLGIPARDVQLILGHSTIAITQQIYQHDSMASRQAALMRMEESVAPVSAELSGSLRAAHDSRRSRQNSRQITSTPRLSDQVKLAQGAKNTPATGVTVAGVFHDFFGDLTGNRTRIARMKTRNRAVSVSAWSRVTEVNEVLKDRRRRLMLGVVAVNLAVKI